MRARQTLEQDRLIQRATAEGWLEPFFQPVVRLQDGALEGFEALVRCRMPDGRLLAPFEFIPRAEETGAIVEIDRQVLRRACEQLEVWGKTWPSLQIWVSVNLSAAQFQAPGLVEFVEATLRSTGVPAQRLHLELTESALTIDVVRTQRLLGELKELGVTLLLDDFGTGWSSLSYVQQYPVDIVKIDRSFTKTIDDEGGQELAATIVFMAQQLGLGLVGEGIETRAQYRRLRDMGVELGQGYHFSRPLSAEDTEQYFQPSIPPEEPSRAWDRERLFGPDLPPA